MGDLALKTPNLGLQKLGSSPTFMVEPAEWDKLCNAVDGGAGASIQENDYVTESTDDASVASLVAGLPAAVGVVRQTLTLTSFQVNVANADSYGSAKLIDLPKNAMLVAVRANLTGVKDGTGILAAETGNAAIGSAAASNATLSGAMIDGVDNTAIAGTLSAAFAKHSNDNAAPAVRFVDAATALYLNVALNPTGDGNIKYTGTVDLYFVPLGSDTAV